MEIEKQIPNMKKNVICSKGDMLLTSYNHPINNLKMYQLTYDFKNLNSKKVSIKYLINNIFSNLLEKLNPDLIEKIQILNKINDNELDILILLKHLAKEVGVKQKYILFRASRIINKNTIIFINKDISLIDKELLKSYKQNIDIKKYEPIIFNYGKIFINFNNLDSTELIKLITEERFNRMIDMNFIIDYQIITDDDLPIYMENLLGLMFKKIVYNFKQFIDKLNN